MAHTRVKPGQIYYFVPVSLDVFDARTRNIVMGDRVRVVNLPGCPRANTMGHCHIERPDTGEFIGLVCTNSLLTRQEYVSYLRSRMSQIESQEAK